MVPGGAIAPVVVAGATTGLGGQEAVCRTKGSSGLGARLEREEIVVE
jgi:hypothetical protein